MESEWRLNVARWGLSAPGPNFGVEARIWDYVARLITPIPLGSFVFTHLVGDRSGGVTKSYLAYPSVGSNVLDVIFPLIVSTENFPKPFEVFPDQP